MALSLSFYKYGTLSSIISAWHFLLSILGLASNTILAIWHPLSSIPGTYYPLPNTNQPSSLPICLFLCPPYQQFVTHYFPKQKCISFLHAYYSSVPSSTMSTNLLPFSTSTMNSFSHCANNNRNLLIYQKQEKVDTYCQLHPANNSRRVPFTSNSTLSTYALIFPCQLYQTPFLHKWPPRKHW